MNYQNTKEFLLFQKPKCVILNFILFIVATILVSLFFFHSIEKSISKTGIITCEEEKCILTTRLLLDEVEDILDFGCKIAFSKEEIKMEMEKLSPLVYDDSYTYGYQDISFLVPKKEYEENRIYDFKIILNKEKIYKQILKNI